MDLSNTPIPTGLSLDSPEMKKARVESQIKAMELEEKKAIDLLALIETKEHEDKETQERYTTVTGINQLGLMEWVKKYQPVLFHESLPYPFVLDTKTNLWRSDSGLRGTIINLVGEQLSKVLFDHFGLELVPNSVYNALNAVARDFSVNSVRETDENNPLIEVQHPNLVPFKNGIFNIDDNSIRPIEPSDYITNPLPYDIIEADETDEQVQYIRGFLEWLTGDSVDLLVAYMGFLFYRSQETIQTMLILINGKTSNGRNGKGKTSELIEHMLGSKKNYSSVKMAELADNQNHKFAKKDLHQKFANIDGDAGGHFLNNTEDLKKLSSSDTITAQVKGKESISFKSYARLIMLTNNLPDFRDDSAGIKSRWILVPFQKDMDLWENKKEFTTKDGLYTNERKAKDMYSPEALGKWAFYCIQKFKELIAEHNGSNPFKVLMTAEAKQILRDMAYDNDPIQQFLDDSRLVITSNSSDYIPKNDLWDMYTLYLGRSKGFGKVSFYKRLAELGAITKANATANISPRRRIGGVLSYVIEGITFATDDLEDYYTVPLVDGKARAIDEPDTVNELNNIIEANKGEK